MGRSTGDGAVALGMLGVWVFAVGLGLVLLTVKVWLIGSLVTSSVKAVSNDCGKQYGVERFVSGDWFCPTNQGE